MPSLFTELRRRNVFKVGAAYAIVAWLLIQVADVVLPALQAPEWTVGFVTVQLIIGFPIALLLAWAYEMTPEGVKSVADAKSGESINPATGQKLNYVILGLVVLAVGFLVTDQYVFDQGIRASVVGTSRTAVSVPSPTSAMTSTPARRYSIDLGRTVPKGTAVLDAEIALSPDGRRLVYSVQRGQTAQLYLRELDRFDIRAISGTEGATVPFFSPDGEWVGFFAAGSLYRVSVSGGAPQELSTSMRAGTGGSWGRDGSIVYTLWPQGNQNTLRLHSIPAIGGDSDVLYADSNGAEWTHAWPHHLPDDKGMLFTISPTDAAREGRIVLLRPESPAPETLIQGGYNARYSPTGHIVFMRSAALWAVPFNLDRLEVLGSPVPIVNGVQTGGDRGQSIYSFSDDGLLMYLSGYDTQGGSQRGRTLVWVDRFGNETPLTDFDQQLYVYPRLSPDGQRLAIARNEQGQQHIWVYDLERGTSNRLTSSGWHSHPLWTPDGQYLVSFFANDSSRGIVRFASNGTGQPEQITSTTDTQMPEVFFSDGNGLVFAHDMLTEVSPRQIHIIAIEGDSEWTPIQEPFDGMFASISPDGQWLAYMSNETGRDEIFVRPFPNVSDDKFLISTNGGTDPLWNPQGGELFYRLNDDVIVVPVETEPSFSPGTPAVLFSSNSYVSNFLSIPNYDVSPNGQRFLMLRIFEQSTETTKLIVVDNWFEELNRLAPPSP